MSGVGALTSKVIKRTWHGSQIYALRPIVVHLGTPCARMGRLGKREVDHATEMQNYLPYDFCLFGQADFLQPMPLNEDPQARQQFGDQPIGPQLGLDLAVWVPRAPKRPHIFFIVGPFCVWSAFNRVEWEPLATPSIRPLSCQLCLGVDAELI